MARVDCLVVDEFQDTNPLQFDLLWQLHRAGVPTVVVGDLKQAIMGFQGADPRLFEALVERYPEATRPLTRNWRSQPGIMDFVNALGPGLFGDDYIALEPQSAQSPLAPLDVVAFPQGVRKDQHRVRAATLGEHLKTLLDDDGNTVVDRRSGAPRPLRGGDIAVLCPTHAMLTTYADVLRAQGLRVRLQADGWFTSRPVQIAWHALAYLANPADRHAALYLAVTELGSLGLQDALGQLIEQGRIDEPLLASLDALAEDAAERTVYVLVVDMIRALGLFDVVARWPNGEQARANLLRFMAEAGEFMDANREALACGGYHGAGIQTFLSWLAARVEDKDGDQQPDPRVLDEDAIVLTTWHASKGREWPVVAVCGLDRTIRARLPRFALGYDSFEDLDGLLEHARIEYAPDFAAPETRDRFLEELQRAEETALRRLLYVALTRPRDKLVLEWPSYLAGRERTTAWSILAGEAGLELDRDVMRVGGRSFACSVVEGGTALPDGLDTASVPEEPALPFTGRRAIRPGAVAGGLTPDSRSPSRSEIEGRAGQAAGLLVESYGEGLAIDVGLTGAAYGSFIHRCFEVLGARPDLAGRLAQLTGVAVDTGAMQAITTAVGRFEDWLTRRFDVGSRLREWPLLVLDGQGSVVSGTADLIVETPEGLWVIDHKSDRVDDPAQAFGGYRPQLTAYARALSAEGRTVLGVAINWVRRGEVVLQRWGE